MFVHTYFFRIETMRVPGRSFAATFALRTTKKGARFALAPYLVWRPNLDKSENFRLLKLSLRL
jgi:hypothetical protein